MAIAEEVTSQQMESADVPAMQMKLMQIFAEAADKPAVSANVASTTESVTSSPIFESVNSVSSAGALLYR